MMKIEDYKISKEDHDMLISASSALCEVVELHSHGHLVEVILTSSATHLTDGKEIEHVLIASGNIGDSNNVSCIGNTYAFASDSVFYAVPLAEYSDAIDFAHKLSRAESDKINSI